MFRSGLSVEFTSQALRSGACRMVRIPGLDLYLKSFSNRWIRLLYPLSCIFKLLSALKSGRGTCKSLKSIDPQGLQELD